MTGARKRDVRGAILQKRALLLDLIETSHATPREKALMAQQATHLVAYVLGAMGSEETAS